MVKGAAAIPQSIFSAIGSICWPLDPSLSPAMHFKPLGEMKDIRLQPRQGPSAMRLNSSHALVKSLPETLNELFPGSDDQERRWFGIISVSLLLLGNGFTDEAHDLVTPLSWPHDTSFGFGPSVYSNVSPTARSYATYVHCLVHRREGPHVGELGMTGWANANYWSGSVEQSPGFKNLPHRDWIEQVRALINKYPSHGPIQQWGEQNRFLDERLEVYNSRAAHQLCSRVLSDSGGVRDSTLQEFAEAVAETEVRILLGHALQKAGFDGAVEAVTKEKTLKGQAEEL